MSDSRNVLLAAMLAAFGGTFYWLACGIDRPLLATTEESNNTSPPTGADELQVVAQAAAQRLDVAVACEQRESPPPNCTTETEAHSLELVAEELVAHSNSALDGVLFLNDTLDYMLEFSALPVDSHPDFDFEDDDALSYRLVGTPEGTDARILIGLQSYESEDGPCRYLQMEVEIARPESELLQGAMRYDPRIDLSISYLEDNPSEPTRFAINLTRAVALGESRKAGIQADQGKVAEGSYYWIDLAKSPNEATNGTYGIVDGQHFGLNEFDGISPLLGDITLDANKVKQLLAQLQSHLSTVKGNKPQ